MVILYGSHYNLLTLIADALSSENYDVRLISEIDCTLTTNGASQSSTMQFRVCDSEQIYQMVKDADALILTPILRMSATDVISDCKSTSRALLEAIARLPKVTIINLSRLGVHLTSNAGILECFRHQERLLNSLSNANLHHLRTGYFLENFFSFIPKLADDRFLSGFLPEDIPFFSSSYADVVDICLEILSNELHVASIQILNLRHERLMTPNQIARVISKTGNWEPITYSRFSPFHAKEFLYKRGYTDLSVRKTMEMYDALFYATCVLEVLRTPTKLTRINLEEFGVDFNAMLRKYENYLRLGSQGVQMKRWPEGHRNVDIKTEVPGSFRVTYTLD
jgi:hypothetical protein